MTCFTRRRMRKSFVSAFGFGFLFLTVWTSSALAQNVDNEHQLGGILWTQTSGEWIALSRQSFALARMNLDRDLRLNRRNRMKRAVIVDVDETVLDNSPYQAMLVK